MRDTIESADILYGVGNGLSLCLELNFLAPWKRDVTALELYSFTVWLPHKYEMILAGFGLKYD